MLFPSIGHGLMTALAVATKRAVLQTLELQHRCLCSCLLMLDPLFKMFTVFDLFNAPALTDPSKIEKKSYLSLVEKYPL